MSHLESAALALGDLDDLARRHSAVHRLDARAKTLAALAFVVTVVSFRKHELSGLLPLALYPVGLIAVGGLPASALLKRMMLAVPFVLAVGAFNPLLDRAPLVHIGPYAVSGGWVSFASIMVRFALTVMAALVLIATTGFAQVCAALEKLGLPRVFVMQLLFVYRYVFVLVEEAAGMVRAHNMRSGGRRRIGLKVFGSFVGQLLLRTLDRADRVYQAMLCRGFDGKVRLADRMEFGLADGAFVLGCVGFFLLCRFCNLPHALGTAILEVLR